MTGDPPSVVLSKPTARASHSSVLEGLVGICTPTGSRTQLDREKGKKGNPSLPGVLRFGGDRKMGWRDRVGGDESEQE